MRRSRRLRANHVIALSALLVIGSVFGATTAHAAPTTPQTTILGGFYGPVGGSPADDRAYVTEQDPNGEIYVRVVDTSNGDTITAIPVADSTNWPTNWYSAWGIAGDVVVSPDGGRVYVTEQNQVTVIDATTNSVITNIVSPVHGSQSGITSGATGRMVLSPDGSTLYVTQNGAEYPQMWGYGYYPGDLLRIDTASDTVTNVTTLLGPQVQDMVLTANGQGLYVHELGVGVEHYDVSVSPPRDRGTLSLPDMGQYSNSYLFASPSGTTLYSGFNQNGGSMQFTTVDTSTDTLTGTSLVPSGDGTPIGLSGDGGTLYFAATNGRSQPLRDVVNMVSTTGFQLVGSDSTVLSDLNTLCQSCSTPSPDGSVLYVLGSPLQPVGQFVLRTIPAAAL